MTHPVSLPNFDSHVHAHGKEMYQRRGRWMYVSSQIGARYSECRVTNFEISEDEAIASLQNAAIEKLKEFREGLSENVKRGRNIVLYGPPGSGKDHLLVALIRAACGEGFTADWINGVDLFGDLRDNIGTEEKERSFFSRFMETDVLSISDPVPPWGDLTQFQAAFLFRVVDARYRSCKPTWITGNFEDGEDAKKRIGSQLVDRLRHDGLSIHCNWPSYRKA